VIGIESAWFYLCAGACVSLGAGFVPVRSLGNCRPNALRFRTTWNMGQDTLEIHKVCWRGHNVLIADDLLATGGTGRALWIL